MHIGNQRYSPMNADPKGQWPSIEANLNLRLLQQEAIAWLGEYALSCRDLDNLFEQAVQLTARILDLELAKILELLPDGQQLLLRAGVGWKDGLVGQATVGAGIDSQAGFTLLTEEPIIVLDLPNETRFNGPQLLFDHQVISGMSVTILGKDQPYGVLGVHTPHPRDFTVHDTRFLKSVANILASAVDRFRVEADLRRSRDELAIILNGITEGVTAQDASGRLVYANPTAARLLGYESSEDLLQTPLAEVIKKYRMVDEQGEALPVEKLPSCIALRNGETSSAKIRFRILETGEDHWAIADSAPVFDEQGKVALVVNIFRDITASMQEEQRQKLISEAGRLLSSSLDYETTLANVARMAVNALADWCTVHTVTEKQEIFQLAVAHKDPQKMELAQDFTKKYPPSWESNSRLGAVLRSGQAEYFPEITDAMLQATARSAEHLAMMRALGMKSAMVVPLVARGTILGAITLIWAESGRRYGQEEVDVVQELARRAAIAIDNARLYEAAQNLNAALEERVVLRTEQLQLANRQLMDEIGERVKAESALRESEALLQSLFESAPDATVLVNQAGIIVRINRQVETVFGYQRDELIGAPVLILLPERYRQRHGGHQADFFRHAANRPMGAGRELFARRKDGSEFPADIMLSPVVHHEGELVISSIRDMTEQRHLQAELAETHQRLFESIEAERLSLSRELHDGPIQDLYGLTFNQELLRASIQTEEDIVMLEASKETVLAVIQTLRGICGELRPATLEHLGLEKAIRSHVARLQETHSQLDFQLDLMNEGQKLPERTRLAIYRVYQNAMHNVVRHAKATQVQVRFTMDAEKATLQVQDNGCGFEVPKKWVDLARGGHFGLVSIVERVQAIGGSLSITSTSGEGTNLLVEVPVSPS